MFHSGPAFTDSAPVPIGERGDDSLIASHQCHTHPFIKWRETVPDSAHGGEAVEGPSHSSHSLMDSRVSQLCTSDKYCKLKG